MKNLTEMQLSDMAGNACLARIQILPLVKLLQKIIWWGISENLLEIVSVFSSLGLHGCPGSQRQYAWLGS